MCCISCRTHLLKFCPYRSTTRNVCSSVALSFSAHFTLVTSSELTFFSIRNSFSSLFCMPFFTGYFRPSVCPGKACRTTTLPSIFLTVSAFQLNGALLLNYPSTYVCMAACSCSYHMASLQVEDSVRQLLYLLLIIWSVTPLSLPSYFTFKSCFSYQQFFFAEFSFFRFYYFPFHIAFLTTFVVLPSSPLGHFILTADDFFPIIISFF